MHKMRVGEGMKVFFLEKVVVVSVFFLKFAAKRYNLHEDGRKEEGQGTRRRR